MQLTQRQLEVLAAIESFITKHNYSPTVRELTAMIGLKSPSTTHAFLQRLRDKKVISWDPERPRTMTLMKGRVDDGALCRACGRHYIS